MTPATAEAAHTYENLLFRQDGAVAILQLNRPQAMNALSPELMAELTTALAKLATDESVRCVIITGNEKALAAGADLRRMAPASAVEMLTEDPLAVWDRVSTFPKPLIVAVSGYALGGGMELSLMCDMVIATESAKFGQPEVNIGVIPGAGGTQRLARSIGKARTMELVLTGRLVSAQEAVQMGFVNRVVPNDKLMDEALETAKLIAEKAPLAIQMCKRAVLQAFETPMAAGIEYERKLFYGLFASADQKEGMQAFLEKRAPKFTGR